MASGATPIAYKWLKDGREIPDADATVVNLEDFTTMVIKEATPNHSGNYTCVASNPRGSTSFTARLSIECESSMRVRLRQILSRDSPVAPVWTKKPKDVKVSEGSDASLECEARGEPSPRIEWRRQSGRSVMLRPRASD